MSLRSHAAARIAAAVVPVVALLAATAGHAEEPAPPLAKPAPSTKVSHELTARFAGARTGANARPAPTEAIVTFRYADQLQAARGSARRAAGAFARREADVLADAGVERVRDYSVLPVAAVRIASADELDRLAASPDVLSVQPNRVNHAMLAQSLPLIRQPQAAAAGNTGSGTTVAVLDTGADFGRAAFGSCSAPGPSCVITHAEDFGGDDHQTDDPDNGLHGTNVAGIVHGVAPGAKIAALDVFESQTANDDDILAGIDWAVDHQAALHIAAINLSLGTGAHHTSACSDSSYAAPFNVARLAGIVPVVAAGNDGGSGGDYVDGVGSPACADGAVPVGAVYDANIGGRAYASGCSDDSTAADRITCFSQSGDLLGLLAPGASITAAGVTESGTSQATPHVAGAAAVLAAAAPGAGVAKVVQALELSGPSITDARSGVTRHRLDLPDALSRAARTDAVVRDAGCTTSLLPANDDRSTDPVALPFAVDFFGTQYGELYVNNNGNVTFGDPMGTYTPFSITASVPPMIAPFFADVDTRAVGSALVTWGATTFGGRPAFCVNWADVGYFNGHADKTNRFQLLLVDRSNVGAGDFDIIMNYDRVAWEAGDASGGRAGFNGTAAGAGYSAGDGDAAHFYELPGSLSHEGLLDRNPQGLVSGSRGSQQPGRYVFPIRNGLAPGNSTLEGDVTGPGGAALDRAPVQACLTTTRQCVTTRTGSDGHYSLSALAPGAYEVRAFPPGGSALIAPASRTVQLVDGLATTADFSLSGPTGPPAGTTITDHGTTGDGVPILNWHDTLTLGTTACAGGTVTYAIVLDGETLRSGAMAEGPAGRYTASIAPLYPRTGNAVTTITADCPNPADDHVTRFDVYIDPSGRVVDQRGRPLAGATVTLLRSDVADGPFEAVPDGDAVMSPSNRANPDVTGADGSFGWDVIAGYYQVRAEAPGCTTGTSAVLTIPPPVTDLEVVLTCPYRTVAVSRAGDGAGTVSGGAGIACGATCAGDVPDGTGVTLTATAAAGSRFAGWGGDCAGAGTTPTCTLTASADRQVTATFARVATAGGGGGAAATPPAPVTAQGAGGGGARRPAAAVPARCVVPKLAGRTLKAARQALARAHCKAGKTTRVRSRTVKSGRVVRQSRRSGASLPDNAKVDLVVSRGAPRRHHR